MKKIAPFFAEYTVWEDYINGMYNPCNQNEEEQLITYAVEILSNKSLFKRTCLSLLIDWPISSKVNLTNQSCNRRAWLGQAACSYKFKVPEICTRIAWSRLTDIQRYEANKIADTIINYFENTYAKESKRLHQKMDNYSLFE